MITEVRTRFAPSPTGGLHLGGVRTALFSYLFAKKHNGKFILRIEDTDQNRFVDGAEKYILDTLDWCGLTPDESPIHEGGFGPYRQSERKEIYKQYALQLITSGNAYYAFDTTEDLEKMRNDLRTAENPNPQYDAKVRLKMKNSLTLTKVEVQQLLDANTPYVIRILVPTNEFVTLNDMIRHEVKFDTNLLDDKVLLKADGMPTYHLAVVVDDYLMKISHAFRGEEWLPSAPIHILLWKYLGWVNEMPHWAHLPLILKPDGNGKLSKRDGERLGFPVFAKQWIDPSTKIKNIGYDDIGFLPEAFLNVLVMLGWNDGTEKEIFTLQEMIASFDMSRVHKGGAKYDYEKAKWYNHEWIKLMDANQLKKYILPILKKENINIPNENYFIVVCNTIKDRCTLLPDFITQSKYFYETPKAIDLESIQTKWTVEKSIFFKELIIRLENITNWDVQSIEDSFKNLASEKNIKVGELQLPFRIMLVGEKFGPSVFIISNLIGQKETNKRIENVLHLLK